ncbi:MAG: hypothetical protein O3A19_13195, partial [Planctomycetota bacterium]|nr:hypothetical protein [Planctomycetota bacterium]
GVSRAPAGRPQCGAKFREGHRDDREEDGGEDPAEDRRRTRGFGGVETGEEPAASDDRPDRGEQ